MTHVRDRLDVDPLTTMPPVEVKRAEAIHSSRARASIQSLHAWHTANRVHQCRPITRFQEE